MNSHLEDDLYGESTESPSNFLGQFVHRKKKEDDEDSNGEVEQQLDMLNQEVLDEQQHSFDDERGHKLVQIGSFFNLRKSMAAELSDDVTITDNTVNSDQIFAQAEGDEHQ